MKIITNTLKDGESLYVQVKDLLYLGRALGDNTYIDEYIDLLNSQKTDNDFIRIYDDEKRIIINRMDICDFKELYRESSMLLSRTLINLSFSSINSEEAKQKSEDIRDILAFRRGDLTYSIPLFSDGETYIESEYYNFSSTIIPDCFVLRTVDHSEIKTCDCQEFLSYCLNKVKNNYTEEIKDDYKISESDNTIIVKFNSKNKRKDNKLLSTLKKVKNKALKNEE